MKPENDTRLHPNELPPAKCNGQTFAADGAGENPIDICMARAGITQRQAEVALQVLDETMNSGDIMAMGGSLAEAKREAARGTTMLWGKTVLILDAYTSKQSDVRFVKMANLTMGFCLGFGSLLGVKTFADIARRCQIGKKQSGKQTVAKCADHFLEQLKLEPLLTQRTQAAREEMKAAREEQLNKK